MTPIPQCNPLANYQAHREAVDGAIRKVLDTGCYILGENVEAFEHEFASYTGATHGIGVASGTDALTIAILAAGVGAGDEVVTVSHTAGATIAAIERAGAVPVFADIDPASQTMDPGALESALTPRTKAVVPVHLYGRVAAMEEIVAVAKKRGLLVIEDCAQAHGAVCKGKRAGSLGDIAAFSFYPTKNLGAIGDGGMVVTGNGEFADRARRIRQYGWGQRYISDFPGMNSRLDELQAAILRVKLPYLDIENAARQAIAREYDGILSPLVSIPQPVEPDWSHVYHQYVIQTDQRDAIREQLSQQGISTAIHYPVSAHLQPAYKNRLRCAGSMAATEAVARRILSLPMFPEMKTGDAAFVGRTLLSIVKKQ